MTNVTIIMDIAVGGDLKQYMQDHSSLTPLGGTMPDFMRTVLLQCLDALVYMHCTAKIVHRDLKLANILLMTPPNEPPHLALADFGLSLVFSSIDTLSGHCQGTLVYMAPEVFGGDFSVRSDIWALGICAFEMLMGKRPFSADNPLHLYSLICRADSIPWESYKSLAMQDTELSAALAVTQLLLVPSAHDRSDAIQARAHSWFSQRSTLTQKEASALRASLTLNNHASHFSKTVLACVVARAPINVLRKMSASFRAIDKDGKGSIPCDDLALTLQETMGYSYDEARMIACELDSDMSGEVSYSEFLAGACNLYKKRLGSMLSSAFCVFDSNGDGKLSIEELRQACAAPSSGRSSIGSNILPDGLSIEDLLERLDSNKDGFVDFGEFRDYIHADMRSVAKDVCGQDFGFECEWTRASKAPLPTISLGPQAEDMKTFGEPAPNEPPAMITLGHHSLGGESVRGNTTNTFDPASLLDPSLSIDGHDLRDLVQVLRSDISSLLEILQSRPLPEVACNTTAPIPVMGSSQFQCTG